MPRANPISTFPPTSVLLDKSVVIVIYRGVVHRQLGLTQTDRERDALRILRLVILMPIAGYITQETYNVIAGSRNRPVSRGILGRLRVLQRHKYFKRWARRLTDFHFTYEDAKILSIASFGIDLEVGGIGVDAIATFDLRMMHNYEACFARIEARFKRMASHLKPPYCYVSLPRLMTPGQILEAFLD